MGLGSIFSRKKAPDSLPGIAIDEASAHIAKDMKSENPAMGHTLDHRTETHATPAVVAQPKPVSPVPDAKVPAPSTQLSSALSSVKSIIPGPSGKLPQESDEGFFKDLIKNSVEEMDNLDKLDEWYKTKFASKDLVLQLRDYWQNQKPELFMKTVGPEVKDRIIAKANQLHELEREWQGVYFSLLSKEEEIRKEEKELKEMLGEFVNLCKRFSEEGKKK